MRYIKLRWYFNLLQVLRCTLKNEDYSIEIRGWKRSGLIPLIVEMLPSAEKINTNILPLTSVSPRSSILNFIIGMYIGPIYSLLETEVDRGKKVYVDCSDPAIIIVKK